MPKRKVRENLKFWRKNIRSVKEVVDDESTLEADMQEDDGGVSDDHDDERRHDRRH